jgi:hypothetical protein
MQFEDGPQLPLTSQRKVLVAIGVALLVAQLAVAAAVAPLITGPANANALALFVFWAASIPSSATGVLLIVRQADLPDIATASFIITIASYAAFTLSAALAARGTSSEVNLVDALFLGVTTGALTTLIVWALAQGVARLLRLPTTDGLHAAE